jgi:hypothetical protein
MEDLVPAVRGPEDGDRDRQAHTGHRRGRPACRRRPRPAQVSVAAIVGAAVVIPALFLSDLIPGIIGFGRVQCVRYSLR